MNLKTIISLWKDIYNFLFPSHCVVCGERLSSQEQHLCLYCLATLPRTNYHLVEHSPMEQLFWGQLPIEKACSFFFYDSREIRKIIWAVKYNSQPTVGTYLAELYAREIIPSGFFDGIDVIVPVPLAFRRRLKRGYNQCEYIGKGISRETHIPMLCDVVKRNKNNVSQTSLSRSDRQLNVDGIFTLLRPEKITGKHVLIIDDVMTTGATALSLGKTLVRAGGVRISVLTLAMAGANKGVPATMPNADETSSAE